MSTHRIETRQVNRRWMALVIYVDESPHAGRRYVQTWVRSEKLRPVASNPNAFDWRAPIWR